MIPAHPNDAGTIQVLVVDDQPSGRLGLRMRLELEPDVEVVGEAESGAGAISLARSLRPDVVLMDVRMPGMDGISAARTLREVAPSCAVVFLSLYDDAATRSRAKAAGAAAFVAKRKVEGELPATIRRAAFGSPVDG